MLALGVADQLVDADIRDRAVSHFRAAGIVLPTLGQLADPSRIPSSVTEALRKVGPDDAVPENLFRIHWYNDATRRSRTSVP